MVSWLSAKKTLSDDRLVDVRNVKVDHLNTFLRNHRTLLEKVRTHEYRVLGRCKFLNHLNSDRIPSTIGSVVITAIPHSFITLCTIAQVVVHSKPAAVFSCFLCALDALFNVAFLVSTDVGENGQGHNCSNFCFENCGTTAERATRTRLVCHSGVRTPYVLQFGGRIQ